MRKIIPLLSVCGLIVFAFAFASHNTQAQDQLSGIIDHFTDGDSFIMQGQKVRLWGIDAPEYYQNCLDALGSEMVSAGHAIDYTYFSDGFYKSEERAAKSGQKGIWQGAFTEPYQWRKQNKR